MVLFQDIISALIRVYGVLCVVNKIVLLLLVFLLYGIQDAYSQKYDFKTYSVNDGLPSSYIYDVVVDDFGIVWFASANGLVKFDGINYRNFTADDGLNDELVNEIYVDSDNDLWVATEFGGIFKFTNDSLVRVPELAALDTALIHFITTGPKGSIWFGTNEQGIYEWDKENRLTQKLTIENGLPANQIWDISMSSDGNYWISTTEGLALYEADGGISYTLTQDNGLSGKYAYQALEDVNGNVWVPTSDGVTIIKPDRTVDTIKEINGVELGYVFTVNEDELGDIWIGTERRGLFIYDGTEFTHIKKSNGLSSNFVYRLVKDKDGTMWVATDGDGVSILRNRDFLIYDSNSGLKANSVFSTHKHSDGSIWIGNENGISRYNNNEFENFSIPDKYFADNEIWDIEELPNGNILMLGIDYDIFEYDGTSFSRPEFFDAIYEYYVNDIYVDHEDQAIWFGAFQMLLKYKDGELTKFPPPNDVYWQTDLHSIFRDSKGYLWLSTHAGLANFDGTSFKYLTEKEGLEGNSIYDVKEDGNGNLWVGTNKGIHILKNFDDNRMPRNIIPFSILDTYMQETIFLQFDKDWNLWQGTNGGLNYFDLSNWEEGEMAPQQHFPFNEFGHGIEFNGVASVLEDDGTLWFGSNSRGLIRANISTDNKSKTTEPIPEVFLREVLANNNPVYRQLDTELNETNITLDYDRNNINFRFNGVDFKNPNRISYKYKLQGFDEEWISGGDIDEVRYTNIPPGKYDFLVQSKSIASDWSSPIYLASIEIENPYWKTFGFFILVGLTFLLAMMIIIRSVAESLEKKHLKNLVDDQTKDIQSALAEKEVLIKEIHHRVKNNLAVVSGLLELQSWTMNDGEAKNAIHESKMRVLAMSKIHENLYQNEDLAKVNFKKFLEDLVESISFTMRNPKNEVKINLEIDETHIDVNTGIPMGLMVNEILSNCYKHAFTENIHGEICIRFVCHQNEFQLDIKDNGKGSDRDILNEEGSSLGMTLVKSLCSQINAEITYTGTDGSLFEIKIPRNK